MFKQRLIRLAAALGLAAIPVMAGIVLLPAPPASAQTLYECDYQLFYAGDNFDSGNWGQDTWISMYNDTVWPDAATLWNYGSSGQLAGPSQTFDLPPFQSANQQFWAIFSTEPYYQSMIVYVTSPGGSGFGSYAIYTDVCN